MASNKSSQSFELAWLYSTITRLYFISQGYEPDNVYTEAALEGERPVTDYDTLVAFYEEVHNALRTIWRSRRVRWLAPLREVFEELPPDTERSR